MRERKSHLLKRSERNTHLEFARRAEESALQDFNSTAPSGSGRRLDDLQCTYFNARLISGEKGWWAF